MKIIPFSSPDINEQDIESVAKVIKSGWLTHGNYSEYSSLRKKAIIAKDNDAAGVIFVSSSDLQ